MQTVSSSFKNGWKINTLTSSDTDMSIENTSEVEKEIEAAWTKAFPGEAFQAKAFHAFKHGYLAAKEKSDASLADLRLEHALRLESKMDCGALPDLSTYLAQSLQAEFAIDYRAGGDPVTDGDLAAFIQTCMGHKRSFCE